MKKIIALVLIFAGIAAFVNKDRLSSLIKKEVIEPASLELADILHYEETLPEPLQRAADAIQTSQLTVNGVVTLTNQERTEEGLPKLVVNARLTRAAEAKLDDMFAKQYFEHESPDGKGPSDLARAAGYEYIIVGENLALGNFKDDADLVLGWMNSPGHRANIMNPKYQEIGVAVKQGMYQGKRTWMAVQEFGTPLSSCPGVNLALRDQIRANEAQINQLEILADAKRAELETANSRSEYNQKVGEYNEVARKINALVAQTKTLVNQYNAQVNAFNACISK